MQIKKSCFWLLAGGLCFAIGVINSRAQNNPSVYFRNFVYHQDGKLCTEKTPQATFTAYLNHDRRQILTENAPRWDLGGDPNIDGKGTFGIELGNFANPQLQLDAKISVRFTCSVTKQQGTLTDSVSGIPWYRFPLALNLKRVNLPATPDNLSFTRNAQHRPVISWTPIPGVTYAVYRRDCTDLVANGKCRMLYVLVAENLTAAAFTDTTANPDQMYGYLVYSVSPEGIWSSHSIDVNDVPVGFDFSVGWIARLPRQDFIWGSIEPDAEGWPGIGQNVVWQATVKNWSDQMVTQVPYRWLLDQQPVDSGMVNLPANGAATVGYLWAWTFDRHELEFQLDPQNIFPEEEEFNNKLLIYTNAIAVGFYVEQRTYDYFHQYQKLLGVHSNSWEDWAQRHVRRWNQMFANAIYPDSPQGVLDRIRIDQITVVPDGALPLAGGLPSNNPNLNDRTVDLQWGFDAKIVESSFYANHSLAADTNPFYFEGSLLHELGHARYLIDLYGMNVHEDGSRKTIAIQENGQPIAGTAYLPFKGDAVYLTPLKGLMNSQYTYIDPYSTAALNLIAGHRAVKGNCNAPGNIGIFMNDLPRQNRLTLMDPTGVRLAGANLKIFRATPQSGVWYGKHYDNQADGEFTADSLGQVLVGRCPFDPNGQIHHDYGWSNAVLILRVAHLGKIGYTFLEVTAFNFEYWRGHKTLGNYEVTVNLIDPTAVAATTPHDLPCVGALFPNFPNPFNNSTRLHYYLPGRGYVALQIFDMLGQRVTELVATEQPAGEYHVTWNALNDMGQPVASGVYFYSLRFAGRQQIGKMLLLR
ncbi:T9SS type A sorting domain-containing protein [candidate division KSB1 bacterium]|nr:T9SS type A sorting domain-containing protein [candidate division KSB1 bacterium]